MEKSYCVQALSEEFQSMSSPGKQWKIVLKDVVMLMPLYKKNKSSVSGGQASWMVVQKHNLKLDHIL